MIGLSVLVSREIIREIEIFVFFLGGVRKHLWHRAYPEKLYFVGELMSMSDLSPKMVLIN